MARTRKILLEIDPHSVVDCFEGVIERGERKYFTDAEATDLLALNYGGRAVFVRCDEPNDSDSQGE